MSQQSQQLKRLTVQRKDELPEAPGQTRNARRLSGVAEENTQVKDLWFGKVHTGP